MYHAYAHLVLSRGKRTDLVQVRAVGVGEDVIATGEPVLELRPVTLLREPALLDKGVIDVTDHRRSRATIALGLGHAPCVAARGAGRLDP